MENGLPRAIVTDKMKYVALRYSPERQAEIEKADHTGTYPPLTTDKKKIITGFRETFPPELMKLVSNSLRWHKLGTGVLRDLTDFPFMFDAASCADTEAGVTLTITQDREVMRPSNQHTSQFLS